MSAGIQNLNIFGRCVGGLQKRERNVSTYDQGRPNKTGVGICSIAETKVQKLDL